MSSLNIQAIVCEDDFLSEWNCSTCCNNNKGTCVWWLSVSKLLCKSRESPLCCMYTPFYPQNHHGHAKKPLQLLFLYSQKSNVNANSIMKNDSESP